MQSFILLMRYIQMHENRVRSHHDEQKMHIYILPFLFPLYKLFLLKDMKNFTGALSSVVIDLWSPATILSKLVKNIGTA